MQKGLVQNQMNFKANGPQGLNANSLISSTRTKPQGKLSFANEFVKVQEAASEARNAKHVINQEPVLNESTKPNSSPRVTQSLSAALGENLSAEAQAELKKLDNQELQKEIQKIAKHEKSTKDSHELSSKLHSSETTMASAVQDHQSKQHQATEAIREGNVDAQQAAYDHAQERKRQLANWEDLAPRIIEDPKNRAVRIDIPGLVDLETIIVRIKQGEVSIQTVGEKKVMERLQASEASLGKKLREHNIQLGTLQTFDASVVAAGAQQKQA